MPPIEVSARAGPAAETDADTRVVGVFEDERPDDPALAPLIDSGEAKGGLRKLAVTHEDAGGSPRRVLAVGLGKRDEFDSERARVAAAAAAGRAKELGARSLSWALPAQDAAGGLVEGTLLALYTFDRFKTSGGDESEDEAKISSVEVSAPDGDVSDDV